MRLLKVPKWTIDAVSKVLTVHPRLFVGTPGLTENQEELSFANFKQVLPVYVTKLPARRRARRSKKPLKQSWFKPKRIAWRFFLETKQGVNVAVELHAKRGIENYHQLQHGQFIQHTFDSIQRVMRSTRVKKQNYSLCLVQVPMLYFSALWLIGSRGRDLFIPLVNFPGRLKTGRFYARAAVVSALGKKLSERRKAHETLLARRAASKVLKREGIPEPN